MERIDAIVRDHLFRECLEKTEKQKRQRILQA